MPYNLTDFSFWLGTFGRYPQETVNRAPPDDRDDDIDKAKNKSRIPEKLIVENIGPW